MREIGKILILTVGTGTAGRESNVAEGIMAAIRHTTPQLAVLIPSSSPDSLAVAEIVAEGVAQTCPTEIQSVPEPDKIDLCRSGIKKIIAAAKTAHPGTAIVLNPTSGTKQMTAAAVLAALECGVESIEFISGPRQDGVVITGQERVERGDLNAIRATADLRTALTLLKAGSCDAATKLLDPHMERFPVSFHLSKAISWWDRFGYRQAKLELDRITTTSEELSRSRRALDNLATSPTPSPIRAADMLNFARRCMARGQVEEALGILYRAAEAMARILLKPRSNDDAPSLGTAFHQLASLNPEPAISEAIGRCSGEPWKTLQFRQKTRYGHGAEFADPAKVAKLLETMIQAASKDFPDLASHLELTSQPDIATITAEELQNA